MPPKPEDYGTAKLPAIIFGDDNWGVLVDREPEFENNKGILMKRFLVAPKGHLIKNYKELMRPGVAWINTKEGPAIWVEYPTVHVHEPNHSKTNEMVRVDCSFGGRDTYYTRLHRKYTSEIKSLQEELETMLSSLESAREENRRLLDETATIVKKQTEIYKSAGGGRVGGANEESNEEERRG